MDADDGMCQFLERKLTAKRIKCFRRKKYIRILRRKLKAKRIEGKRLKKQLRQANNQISHLRNVFAEISNVVQESEVLLNLLAPDEPNNEEILNLIDPEEMNDEMNDEANMEANNQASDKSNISALAEVDKIVTVQMDKIIRRLLQETASDSRNPDAINIETDSNDFLRQFLARRNEMIAMELQLEREIAALQQECASTSNANTNVANVDASIATTSAMNQDTDGVANAAGNANKSNGAAGGSSKVEDAEDVGQYLCAKTGRLFRRRRIGHKRND